MAMPVQIMAIINTSPDSFAGDGVEVSDETALRQRIETALQEGADLLDIGGQSTRPGAEIISESHELARVLPAIKLARSLTDKPISIDTFKPSVAKAALDAGATIVNDIHGCDDPKMVELVAKAGCEVIVMHSRGTPKTMSQLTDYPKGVVAEIVTFFKERTKQLVDAGIKTENIIIDPGIGFAKTGPQSYELTRNLQQLTPLGFRVLYGASNKSFIGKALAIQGRPAPVQDRTVGTIVVQSYAMLHGADIIRVHDVRAAMQTRTIVEALLGRREVMP
jgi:dihydropteroate synthase